MIPFFLFCRDLRKRLEQAQQKIGELESKQKEAQKFLNTNVNSDKQIGDMQVNMSKLKQQSELLQKKLKEESDRKIKLEKDLEREQQKLKELEMKSDKQGQILKKKTEDLANAQRRLRLGSSNSALNNTNDEQSNSNSNKHWVEQEMEKIVQEKRQMEAFKEELLKREELVAKKEYLMKEKNELEAKKLGRASLNNEKLENVTNKPKVTVKELEETHSSLLKQRKLIDDRLGKGDMLSSAEERRLIEIDEAIEALEVAIDYGNESIREHENKLRNSILFNNENNSTTTSSDHIAETVLGKLSSVPYEETKYLLKKFFKRIIDLKEYEHKRHLENGELQVQLEEQARLVEQLKLALNSSSNDLERRLLEQKSKSDKSQKLLSSQLNESHNKIALMEREISLYKEKLNKLKSSSANKSTASSGHNSAENVNEVNGGGGGNSSGGFYLKPNATNMNNSNNSLNDSAVTLTNDSTQSVKTVKVSRRDLRRLTEDEVIKRSVKKENFDNYDYIDTNVSANQK
jgi:myosin heavy subunit